ncbi:MAG: hypothetical protein OHK0024_26980 [Thalassobaculales bacterium]
MAMIAEYAQFARSVYNRDEAFALGGWQCIKWESGTWYGNGFQGGIFIGDREIIVACKGTSLKTQAAPSDLSADLRIGVGAIPNQAGSAYKMVKAAMQVAAGRVISITGHSLGGALAQVVGYWCNVPFVSFNAPPMKGNIRASHFNFLKPVQMARSWSAPSMADINGGWNFRVNGDFISWAAARDHLGVLVELTNPNADGSKAHAMKTCMDALSHTDWFTMQAFNV